MRNFLFSISLFISVLFFCILSIMGVAYEGGESRELYRVVCAFFFGVTVLLFLGSSIRYIRGWNLTSLAVVILYCLIGLASPYARDKSVLCLIAFSLPATIIGIYYAQRRSLDGLVKWLDVIYWIITVALVYLTITLRNAIISETSYYSQSLSYYASLAFLINLFLLKYGKMFERFPLFQKRGMVYISYVLLPLYAIIILLSGGRGGFVVIVVGLLILYLQGSFKSRNMMGWSIAIVIIIALVLYLFRNSSYLSVFGHNFSRVFSYLGSGGVNMGETSGRDSIYEYSIELIANGPPFGYGLFGYKDYFVAVPYPHNLFLEWMLQGGLLFFAVCMIVICFAISRFRRIRKWDSKIVLLTPFIVYSLTKLMFSGSYMEDPFFWFWLAFVFNYSPKIKSV